MEQIKHIRERINKEEKHSQTLAFFQTVMIIDLLLAELHNLEVICNL